MIDTTELEAAVRAALVERGDAPAMVKAIVGPDDPKDGQPDTISVWVVVQCDGMESRWGAAFLPPAVMAEPAALAGLAIGRMSFAAEAPADG